MSEVNSSNIEWWREARFGMFIHWGLYAVAAGEWQGKRIPGIGEWIMHVAKIDGAAERKLERSGDVSGWKSTDARLSWSFRLREPGRYQVFVQTFMDREGDLGFREKTGSELYGNHRMRVDVSGGNVSGLVGRKDMIMDEGVNRWHTAESDIGAVTIAGAGVSSPRLSSSTLFIKTLYTC